MEIYNWQLESGKIIVVSHRLRYFQDIKCDDSLEFKACRSWVEVVRSFISIILIKNAEQRLCSHIIDDFLTILKHYLTVLKLIVGAVEK